MSLLSPPPFLEENVTRTEGHVTCSPPPFPTPFSFHFIGPQFLPFRVTEGGDDLDAKISVRFNDAIPGAAKRGRKLVVLMRCTFTHTQTHARTDTHRHPSSNSAPKYRERIKHARCEAGRGGGCNHPVSCF